MKIRFNQLGAVIETITNDEPLRQGNVGNTLTAIFEGKYNGDYIASLSYKRSDGSVLGMPTSVIMTPSTTDRTAYTFKFEEAWFFALYGETSINIDLTDSKGNVVVNGEIKYNIEQTIYTSDPKITIDEYNNLVSLIAGRMPIPEKAIVLQWGEELPEVGEPNTLYFKPTDETEKIYDRYWFNYSTKEYEYLGDTTIDLSQYQKRDEKGQANGYTPLDKYAKVPVKHLVGVQRERIYGKYNSSTSFTDNATGQEAVKGDQYIYIDVQAKPYTEYEWIIDEFVLVSDKANLAKEVIFDNSGTDLNSHDVQNVIEELNTKKVNVNALQWTTLPVEAIDKKTFYKEVSKVLKTANNKIYMWGAPEETPIKEFFDIWGKPTDFKATHVYIVIESISNTSSRDSFKMTIHSSNYANMYFMVVNGYSGQLVGASDWISYNLLAENKQKQLAKIDGYYELMTVGDSLGVVDPLAGKDPVKDSFIERETANETAIKEGVAIINEIGGNTIIYNQLSKVENATRNNNGITFIAKSNEITMNGTATDDIYLNITEPNIISVRQNHKYYFYAHTSKLGSRDTFYFYNNILDNIPENPKEIGNGSIQVSKGNNDTYLFIYIKNGTTLNNVKVKLMFVDLTLMFGVKNEPADINDTKIINLKNNLSPTYDNGNVINGLPSKLESIGTNLFDGLLELGGLNDGTGEPFDNANIIRTKNFIQVIPNRKYLFKPINEFNKGDGNIFFYDKDYNFIKAVYYSSSDTYYATAIWDNAKYVKFIFGGVNGLPTNPQFMMLLDGQSFDRYIPYKKDKIEFDAKKYFPDGMNGVNNIHDTIEKNKAVQRLNRIDLGDIDWFKDSQSRIGSTGISALVRPVINGSTIANAISSKYETVSNFDVYGNVKDKILSITPDGAIYIYDTELYPKTPTEIKKALKGIILIYELKNQIITPIEPALDMSYDVEPHGIEKWYSKSNALYTLPKVAVYTDIQYRKDLAYKLSEIRGKQEQENIDNEQDRRLTALENDMAHYSADIVNLELDYATSDELKSYSKKYHYRGNIYDIELYNQLLAVDDIAKGSMFSVEITTDTPREQLNKGFPKLSQGSLVYGWFTTDELGQPMNIICEQGMFKIIDGGTLTCEVIDGEDFDIEYRVASQHQFNISTPQLAHLVKGLRVWYQYEFQGKKRLQHQDIYFTDKGDSDATSYISNGLNIVGFLADTIAIEFDMETGVIALRSTGTMPQTFKLVDLKGLR